MAAFDHPSPTTAITADPSPVVLDALLVERIWGVTDLTPWHTETLETGPVGEIWLTAEACRAQGGPWNGQTLAEITAAHPRPFGDDAGEGFPLLIKLLFPQEKLSVQVHPDDVQARALGMPRGKTECWYILSAEPGAQVAVGLREPMTQAAVKAAIEDGTLESRLRMLPVKAGDMVFVDAGTVHAIGPGMVVLETQQYSDTTYRLWDYGRPRALHIDEGTAVTRTDTAAGLVAPVARDGFTRLVACAYFAVDRFDLSGVAPLALGEADKLQILIALSGDVSMQDAHGATTMLPHGRALLLPAGGPQRTLAAQTKGDVIRVLQP